MKRNLNSSKSSRAVFYLFLLVISLNSVMAASPQFVNINHNENFTAIEDQNFTMFVYGNDSDGDYPLNFTDDSHDETIGFYAFNMSNYNSTTALINFTPENDDVGHYSFHLILEDTNISDGPTTITIHFNVTNTNDAPIIINQTPYNLTNTTVKEEWWLNLSVNVSDDDMPYGDVLNYTWYLDGVINTSALNYTNDTAVYHPRYLDAGMHNITVVVMDSENASDKITWVVNVTNVNRNPVFNKTIENITWSEDINLTNNFTLDDHFYDNDTDDTLTFGVQGNNQIYITIDPASHNVSFYPPSNFFGSETVRFYLYDGYNTTYSNYVVLNVTNVNDAPVVDSIDNKVHVIGFPFVLQVSANDADNDPLLYYDNTTLFEINRTTGLINFTPNSSQMGIYPINISVSDGTVNSSTSFILRITNNTDPILDSIQNWTIKANRQFNLFVDATDNENNTLDFSDDTGLFNIIDYDYNTGLISFTPTTNQTGTHNINISVFDGFDGYDWQIVVFNITNNTPPYILPIPSPQNATEDILLLIR